jgi:hypothetical protein
MDRVVVGREYSRSLRELAEMGTGRCGDDESIVNSAIR